MRVRWFGEPWPSDELRAPICEDDDFKIPTPVGYRCSGCDRKIESLDQGVVMAYAGPLEDGLTFTAVTEEGQFNVVAEHLDCMLYETLGMKKPV